METYPDYKEQIVGVIKGLGLEPNFENEDHLSDNELVIN